MSEATDAPARQAESGPTRTSKTTMLIEQRIAAPKCVSAPPAGEASPPSRVPEQLAPTKLNCELSQDERWYVVHAQPRREALAEAQLAAQGFHAFLPREMKTVRHARKLRTVQAAVFPRYLFVVLDLDRDRWRSVNGTFGVTRLLMAEDRPLAVPKGIVETLIGSTDDKGIVHFEQSLRPGQAIRLIAGPFAEALGVLTRLDGAGRVEVLMKILNGEVRLNLSRDWVKPLIGSDAI